MLQSWALAQEQVEQQWLFGHIKQGHTSLWVLLCQGSAGFGERLLCTKL